MRNAMIRPARLINVALALIGALAMLAGIGTAAFFFSGLFNVAADHPDPKIVNWVLVQVRMASIRRHAVARPPAGLLENAATVQAGALAYARIGCVNCHGEPGVMSATFSEGLNPPPDLRRVVNHRTPEELFWVIKHGIKMTAMPSFGADRPPVKNTTIWAIVAYLSELSSVSDANFKAWNETPIGGNWVSGCGSGRTSGCGPGR
ncbi:MAG: c-type cytochrome [Steroidobacteraceae bacterium]